MLLAATLVLAVAAGDLNEAAAPSRKSSTRTRPPGRWCLVSSPKASCSIHVRPPIYEGGMGNLIRPDDQLYRRVAEILEQARGRVARTVNTAMVQTYWLIGREIVQVEQRGARRAEYGDELMQRLATRLTRRYGAGFSVAGLRRMRQFFASYPNGSALSRGKKRSTALSESANATNLSAPSRDSTGQFPPTLSWSHYLVLMRVENPLARSFYEIEASRECWSVRELERQVGALLFERLAASRDGKRVRELARRGQKVDSPADVLKDPFVLEFLDVKDNPLALERDVEQAIIDRIHHFLLEMGKGFCFVARQKRLTLEGDHYFVDLVFYNRLLRCFVLVDIKLGKLTHQDLGQMQMYVNFFDRYQRQPDEAKTIGIVLCSDKNDAMVKISLPEDGGRIRASRYQMYLPSEAELRRELSRDREEVDRVLKLTA